MTNLRHQASLLKWRRALSRLLGVGLWLAAKPLMASVGDPQLGTDHPWYPGELACSTFSRLLEVQREVYRRVTGRVPVTDEDKAMASWVWRNAHYFHGEEGAEDLWGGGFRSGDLRTREYWTGLFAHGMGLCGTTHSQWTAEMEVLLGHARGRGVGVDSHNSFEVYLTGGDYGAGQWALLDHDLSTVIFDKDGTRLLSIPEVVADRSQLTSRSHAPEKQQGWLVCGLHPDDGAVYRKTLSLREGLDGRRRTFILRNNQIGLILGNILLCSDDQVPFGRSHFSHAAHFFLQLTGASVRN